MDSGGGPVETVSKPADGGSDGCPDLGRLKLFISYSRADLAFADELVGGLEIDNSFDVAIDRHSIIEGEDWKKRLGALIADADTIVFLLSPASAKSEICAWEVDEAVRLTKRIVPVLVTPLGALPAPPQLAALNYTRFDPLDDGRPRSFTAGIKGLVRALKADLGWLREHTRLLARASEWAEAGRPANRLLDRHGNYRGEGLGGAAAQGCARAERAAPRLHCRERAGRDRTAGRGGPSTGRARAVGAGSRGGGEPRQSRGATRRGRGQTGRDRPGGSPRRPGPGRDGGQGDRTLAAPGWPSAVGRGGADAGPARRDVVAGACY